MPLPRMTTRRWMIAAAVVGLAMAAETTRRRWEFYRYQAKLYDAHEYFAKDQADFWREMSETGRDYAVVTSGGQRSIVRTDTPESVRSRKEYEKFQRRASAFATLKRKYERAARRPWLTVPPDPPEPE